jgi:hypothetical protein
MRNATHAAGHGDKQKKPRREESSHPQTLSIVERATLMKFRT